MIDKRSWGTGCAYPRLFHKANSRAGGAGREGTTAPFGRRRGCGARAANQPNKIE